MLQWPPERGRVVVPIRNLLIADETRVEIGVESGWKVWPLLLLCLNGDLKHDEFRRANRSEAHDDHDAA